MTTDPRALGSAERGRLYGYGDRDDLTNTQAEHAALLDEQEELHDYEPAQQHEAGDE